MFWKSNNNTNTDEKWSIAQGQLEGKPILTRFRETALKEVSKKDFPFQIGIAVPLSKPTDDGLPQKEEMQELENIEKSLEQAFNKEGAIFVISITTNGMREFVFYTKKWEPEKLEGIVKEVNKAFPKSNLQFMLQKDPNWETFAQFAR